MLDSGLAPTTAEFINEYCCPFKFQERWIAAVEAKFGATATRFPAWARVCRNFRTERGRMDT
eukprot:588952-Alexandrium_andersonii.AAC.1